MRARGLKIGLALLALALLFLLTGAGRAAAFPVPPKPLAQHNPKIESSLEIAMQAQGLPEGGLRAVVELAHRASSRDLAELRARGAIVEAHSGNLVRARIPLDRLEEVAALSQVRFIRRPYQPFPLNEALGPIGAVLLQAHGFKGKGVRVAVIDVGFAGLSSAIAGGALPRGIIADTKDYTSDGLETGTNHGTAVAELVHSVAPGALLFLKKVGDEVDLANAVDDSLRQGIRVIIHSVGWFNTNFTDGTGIIDEIAGRAYRAGILWVNAAGNHAEQHWSGPFRDRDGDGWAEFQGSKEELKLQASFGEVQLFLTWNDWPRTCQDYDLFLYNAKGALVASSQNYQSCSEPPTEEIDYLVLQPGTYYVRVLARNRLNLVALKIFTASQRLEPAVPQGSLPAPADAPGVLSVGAIPIGRWESGPQEPFSSQGPTTDGRIKPDIMGPDNVRTFTEIGLLHRFRGTSAAAPQVAGAAALLLSQHPDWSADRVWMELERSSIDMGPPGKDSIYGWGRLNLSLGRPSAERTIHTIIRPGDQAIQGGSFLVTVRAQMPPSRFGGLVLQEQLPPGLQLVPLGDGGAEFDPKRLEWTWPIVEPGAAREIEYRVLIPQDQPPGSYQLEGKINGQAVGGEAEFRVLPPLTVAAAVAHWNIQKRLIDLELDDRISSKQLEEAIGWWLAAAGVPGTGGRVVGSGEIARLIAHHLTGTSTAALLPPLPAWEVARATRAIAPAPDGSLLVTVRIEAHSKIYGLRLSESWPRGWQIEPVDCVQVNDLEAEALCSCQRANVSTCQRLTYSGAPIFKESTNGWLWPRIIEPGEDLTVRYRARPPAGTEFEAEVGVRGTISSALPAFSIRVGGAQQAELGAPRLELAAVKTLNEGSAIKFLAEGRGIAAIRVQVFDLSGQKIYESGWAGNGVLWKMNGQGETLWANGVYLYLLTVRGLGGGQAQKIGKVVILR